MEDKTESTSDTQPEYISGLQLVAVLSSITLVTFLMLLDTSIVATVSIFTFSILILSYTNLLVRQFHASHPTSTPSTMWDGMGRRIYWRAALCSR
jgi:hypothetical protein